MNAKLIFQDGTSNKFWHIQVDGNKHTVTYGRVGSSGTSKTKTFASEDKALKDAYKLINSKKKKGYVDVAEKAKVIRDDHTFAGKPIKEFTSSFDPSTAIKIVGESYSTGKPTVVEQLEKLAQLNNITQLDTLLIGAWVDSYDKGPKEILDQLVKLKPKLSGLKHLFIGDMGMEECEISWIIQFDYSEYYQHFPTLESFGVKGGQNLRLGEIKLPLLKNLVIETGGLDANVIQGLTQSDLPHLEYIDIWLGTEEYGGSVELDHLKPILEGKFPNLKYLGLKNYDHESELAKALQGAAVLKNLEVLDLSMGILKDEGAEALYNNNDLLNLKHINCRHHFISAPWQEKLKEKFSLQEINLDDAEEPYDDDFYYVEIGE